MAMAEKRIQRASFGFSWADEVEREEREEEEEKAVRRKEEEKSIRKPNPFGAARPREVVLEEKGVDWRKLDQGLDSNLRKNKLRGRTSGVSMTTASISKQAHSSVALQHLNQNKPEIQNASSVCPQQQNQHIDQLVPPLKYPPKNIMALMEQIRTGRTGRLHEAVDNSNLNRYPCSSDIMGRMQHWPIDAARSRTTQANFNVNMNEAGFVRVHHRFQSGRAEEMQANGRELIDCRKSYKDDDEVYWDYVPGDRFMCAGEKQQPNGRRILADLNMDRGFLGMNKKYGEEYHLDYAEEGNGRGNSNVQKYLRPLGWGHSLQNYDTESGSFGGAFKGKVFRSASQMTERARRDNMGELGGRSNSVIEGRSRAKNGPYASNKKGTGLGGDNSKKRGALSAPSKSGSHKMRQKKQARK